MKETLRKGIKMIVSSKRFVAFVVGIIIFVVGIYTTSYTPIQLAESIGIMCGIYIGGDTIRKSDTKDTTPTQTPTGDLG